MRRELRRWQAEALPLALAAIDAGTAGVIVATTGGGKSVFAAEMIRQYRLTHPDARIVVTTPSVNLVEQLADTIASWLGPGVVGKYYTKAKQWRRPVVIACNASVVSLAEVLTAAAISVDLWVADEAHKTETEQFGGTKAEGDDRPVDRLSSKRRIGVTATPFRAAEAQRLGLFDAVIYRYSPADALRDGVIVPWRFVRWDAEEVATDEAIPQMIAALGDRVQRGPGTVNASSIADAVAYVETLATHGITAKALHSQQAEAVRIEAVAQLKNGEIDCIVHVAMLVEGVDFPWLRWGAFRRDVGSRVRFIQELGRYLRSAPEKTEAIILDPNGLEDRFAVTYEAALGWSDPEVELEDDTAPTKKSGEARTPRELMTARSASIRKYVRELTQGMIADGMIAEAPKSAGWHLADATNAQRKALGFLVGFARRIEPQHAAALRLCATWGGATRGLASALIDIFGALKAKPSKSVWSPPLPVRAPEPHAFDWIEPVSIAYVERERYDERRYLTPVIALAAHGAGVSHAAARVATEHDSRAAIVRKYALWVASKWPGLVMTVPDKIAADRLAEAGLACTVDTLWSGHPAVRLAEAQIAGVSP